MKRSRVVALTLAGVSLSLTGCRRTTSYRTEPHNTPILPPTSLSPTMRGSLPAFVPGQNVSAQNPPLNAYDPELGYYHTPCSGWFPYPYDHYDSRWGYYRCGRWTKTTNSAMNRNGFSNVGSRPFTSGHTSADDLTQPAGAPIHGGIPHSQATSTRSSSISRGGFGSTGRSSSSFFSSGS
jgi:hypothetical protein